MWLRPLLARILGENLDYTGIKGPKLLPQSVPGSRCKSLARLDIGHGQDNLSVAFAADQGVGDEALGGVSFATWQADP